jgi:glucose/arabinose dehydrogenase
MACAAYIILSLMLLSSIVAAIPSVTAQGQGTGPDDLVVMTEEVVDLESTIDNWCGVTFEFLPDGRMICGELRSGKVRLIENNTLTPEPLIDLDVFAGWKMPGVIDEQGLIGLAIDPNFKENHHVYVHYTYVSNATSNDTSKRISRYTMIDNKLVEEKVLLEGIPAAKQHVGGPIEFGPDGKLYITGGEAGRRARADDLRSPLGKILRINPDGSIPQDNPFPGEPYYTIGHRNVFGIAFHPLTGIPYITENGNQTNDEINILYPGKHYGWPDVNGTTNDPRYISPLYATGPGTIAPTEMEFYKGDKYPDEFVNDLFFMAFNTRSLERIELVGPDSDIVTSYVSYPLPNTFPGSYTDIELGPDGYFYVSHFKSIFRVLFERSNIPSSITVSAPASGETASETIVTATLVDDGGMPIANVPMSLLVSGEPRTTVQTNEDGKAIFSYFPLSAGTLTLVARFDGSEKYLASTSDEVTLNVEGPSTLPPQVLEARTSDNFLVRLTLLPSGNEGNNSTLRFDLKVVDPRSQTEASGIPYHVEILRGTSVLFSKNAVTTPTLSLHDYEFQELGPAEIVVTAINNSENRVTFGINVVPEFPIYAILVPLMGIAIALAAVRYGKMGYGRPSA